jgi:hypothetical protein
MDNRGPLRGIDYHNPRFVRLERAVRPVNLCAGHDNPQHKHIKHIHRVALQIIFASRPPWLSYNLQDIISHLQATKIILLGLRYI